jgi:hypothetical protein
MGFVTFGSLYILYGAISRKLSFQIQSATVELRDRFQSRDKRTIKCRGQARDDPMIRGMTSLSSACVVKRSTTNGPVEDEHDFRGLCVYDEPMKVRVRYEHRISRSCTWLGVRWVITGFCSEQVKEFLSLL